MILNKTKCLWEEKHCPLNKIKKKKISKFNNFYEDYIKDYFKNDLKSIKYKDCFKCGASVQDKWFSTEDTYKIYNYIYGQHHRGWSAFYSFNKSEYRNPQYEIILSINKLFKIKNYAEFNCPFQGNFFSILKDSQKKKNIKKIISLIFKRNKLVQLANIKKENFKKNFIIQSKINRQINDLKKINKSKIKKYLIIDGSSSSWGNNCISDNINCRAMAGELFDLKVLNLNEISQKNYNLDLFCFANTLDHTFNPNKILNFALRQSRLVVMFAHCGKNVSKQHLFILQEKFLNFLKKRGVYVFKITNERNVDQNNLAFMFTKNKKIEDNIRKNIHFFKIR